MSASEKLYDPSKKKIFKNKLKTMSQVIESYRVDQASSYKMLKKKKFSVYICPSTSYNLKLFSFLVIDTLSYKILAINSNISQG